MKPGFETLQAPDAQSQKFIQIENDIASWLARSEGGDEACVRYEVPDDLFNDITIDDLKAVVQEGPHQGKSGLWLFARAAAANGHIFLAAWNKWKLDKHLTLADLRVAPEQGDDSGITLLWFLLYSYSAFNDLTYSLVQQAPIYSLDKHDITIEDLRVTTHGISALWLLVDVCDETLGTQIDLLNKSLNQITVKDLRSCLQGEGPQTTLLHKLCDTRSGLIEGVTLQMPKWLEELTLEDFTNPRFSGASALEIILDRFLEDNDNWNEVGGIQYLHAIWEKFGHAAMKEDVNTTKKPLLNTLLAFMRTSPHGVTGKIRYEDFFCASLPNKQNNPHNDKIFLEKKEGKIQYSFWSYKLFDDINMCDLANKNTPIYSVKGTLNIDISAEEFLKKELSPTKFNILLEILQRHKEDISFASHIHTKVIFWYIRNIMEDALRCTPNLGEFITDVLKKAKSELLDEVSELNYRITALENQGIHMENNNNAPLIFSKTIENNTTLQPEVPAKKKSILKA